MSHVSNISSGGPYCVRLSLHVVALSSVSPSPLSIIVGDQTGDEEGLATLSGGGDEPFRLPVERQRLEKARPHPTAQWTLRPRAVRHALFYHLQAGSRRQGKSLVGSLWKHGFKYSSRLHVLIIGFIRAKNWVAEKYVVGGYATSEKIIGHRKSAVMLRVCL